MKSAHCDSFIANAGEEEEGQDVAGVGGSRVLCKKGGVGTLKIGVRVSPVRASLAEFGEQSHALVWRRAIVQNEVREVRWRHCIELDAAREEGGLVGCRKASKQLKSEKHGVLLREVPEPFAAAGDGLSQLVLIRGTSELLDKRSAQGGAVRGHRSGNRWNVNNRGGGVVGHRDR